MAYKLAVFDMDGTLLDTIEDLACAVNHALALSALPLRTTEDVRSFVGNGIRHTLKLAAPANLSQTALDRLYLDFTDYYELHSADHTVAYPGLFRLLTELKEQHILTAVVSNKQDAAVNRLAERFFPGLFDRKVGQRNGIRRKPAPDSVYSVLNTLRLAPSDAVYIGDSEVDLETAKNAGLRCISVSWGYRSKADLMQAGSRQIVDTADALLFAIMNPVTTL